MKKEHFDFLKTNKACESGLKWAEKQSDLYELWNNCHRGDWLLWLAKKLKVDERKHMLCAALCAHTVAHLMTDRRSREAVRIAFLWGRGKATDEKLLSARKAAWAATCGCATTAAALAAGDTALAAASAATWAATRAADADAADGAARAAALATAWAAADAAADRNRLRTAEIARKILTQEVFEKIAELS